MRLASSQASRSLVHFQPQPSIIRTAVTFLYISHSVSFCNSTMLLTRIFTSSVVSAGLLLVAVTWGSPTAMPSPSTSTFNRTAIDMAIHDILVAPPDANGCVGGQHWSKIKSKCACMKHSRWNATASKCHCVPGYKFKLKHNNTLECKKTPTSAVTSQGEFCVISVLDC